MNAILVKLRKNSDAALQVMRNRLFDTRLPENAHFRKIFLNIHVIFLIKFLKLNSEKDDRKDGDI